MALSKPRMFCALPSSGVINDATNCHSARVRPAVGGQAKAGPNEDAAAVRAQWEQVYNSGDADKFAALYTGDAMLFGSFATLFTGTDGVKTYFSKLPSGIKSKMGNQQAIAAGPDVLLSSGFADFIFPDGRVVPFRLTFAIVKVDGKWLIAQHLGSPVPK